ncbi:Uncharacterized protein ACMD2_01115 [Ananas comosus]|uniref:Glutaredoxin domain-containing protein n=1 Tax=Ananas comosus TaxID=4615 RepID=A0A199VUE1_ANACO|nr:Uncharacterized protein ACMD2_01115 [Ananas comosus]
MGCAGSKESRRRDLRRSLSPLRRSLSGETHVVALTSSTLGSLKLDASVEGTGGEESAGERNAAGLVKAKAWTVRTPTETPPNEPESIDAWELMAGLEDTTTPLRRSPPSAAPELERHSFSFPATTTRAAEPRPSSELSNGSAFAIEFDAQVLSTFRRALEELSPQHPSLLLRSPPNHDQTIRSNSGTNTAQFTRSAPTAKAVLYFTSLRGVRKTFEDCCSVRTILKDYGVRVDERDVSMHGGFKEELRRTLGGCHLPSLFARGRYVGGAEEVKQMHESGELGAVLEGCERAAAAAEEEEEGESKRGGPCEGCGDVRFVLCGRCSGSCKVYAEDEEEEEEEGEEEEAINGVFRRCPECNENGIVRCPVCC